ncbi:hypothetical protein [Larkinella rosea]|uniref:DUF4595 domain-containing protein n=1 Tax=Larkinella rosea TaxID=2025312 RepID=A0A3P1C350_9BACT|nr:hypothetical protein [Larkinella rosea]RRB07815.1 hypothetical protein EHT25_08585 [Larkinella rosea]
MKIVTRFAGLSACLLFFLHSCNPGKDQHSLLKPGCQVLTYTIESKESSPEAYVRDETAVLDRDTVKIGKVSTRTYKYDEQDRIIESTWATYNYGGNGGKTLYQYTSDTVTLISTHLGMDRQIHKFPLNKQGLNGSANLKYNADGFLIESVNYGATKTYTIENGNIVREQERAAPPNPMVYEWTYEYDLTRPNLPNTNPYDGKTSKNLLMKVTTGTGVSASSYAYKYIFDESGTKTRRYRKIGEGRYLVADYTITCR